MSGLMIIDFSVIVTAIIVFRIIDHKDFKKAFNQTVKSLIANGYSKNQAIKYAQHLFYDEK